jgi:transcriptional regulator with XRE-family HTH domain
MGWEAGLQDFGEFLFSRIKARGMSIRSFAAVSGIKHPMLHRIRQGKTSPPPDRLDQWAKVLGLVGAEREYFLDLAALASCPPRVLAMFKPGHPAKTAFRHAIELELAAAWAADCEASGLAKRAAEPHIPFAGDAEASKAATPPAARSTTVKKKDRPSVS